MLCHIWNALLTFVQQKDFWKDFDNNFFTNSEFDPLQAKNPQIFLTNTKIYSEPPKGSVHYFLCWTIVKWGYAKCSPLKDFTIGLAYRSKNVVQVSTPGRKRHFPPTLFFPLTAIPFKTEIPLYMLKVCQFSTP